MTGRAHLFVYLVATTDTAGEIGRRRVGGKGKKVGERRRERR